MFSSARPRAEMLKSRSLLTFAFSAVTIWMGGCIYQTIIRKFLSMQSSVSISVVNRGVLARSGDVMCSRRPEVVTTARKVRESCI